MKRKTKKPKHSAKGEMSLLEHLDELRQRFMVMVAALLVGTIVGALISKPVLEILVAPTGTEIGFLDRLPEAISAYIRPVLDVLIVPAEGIDVNLTFLTPTEAITAYFRVSLILGVVVAMPVIMYQIFAYMAPGLELNERRYIILGAPFASLSFASGVAFATFVAIPRALPFLGGVLNDLASHNYSVERYLQFVGNIILWAGLVFETPLIMFFLAKLGVIDAAGFARIWRYVFVGAAIASAIVTPTVDILNMLLIMGPFLVLYGLGIILAWFARRGKSRAAA